MEGVVKADKADLADPPVQGRGTREATKMSFSDCCRTVKILLIYSYPLFDRSKAYEEDIRIVPTGMYYVGAILKDRGYDVEILNWYQIHKTPRKIAETLLEKKPNIIGFSVLNANRWGCVEIAQIAKEMNPNVTIIFGGVAATFLWEHFLKHFRQVDYIITGEGEYSFLHLVEAIRDADAGRVARIKGVAFRLGDEIKKNEDAPFIRDLDELPIPARFFSYQHVVSSRGCPARCTFCASPRFWKRKVRFRSPGHFVEELELLYNKGMRFFYFCDDTFTVDKHRVIEICKKILDKNLPITWFAISRADYIDEDILYWMRRAGCIQISFGVESGSEKIRKTLGKSLATERVKKAFLLTHRYGILARAYFIYGSPGETWDTIRETVDLIKEIKPFIFISYILEIYPGTSLYDDYKKKSGQTDDVWLNKMEGICYFETDPNLAQEQVLAFGRKIREEAYASLPGFVDAIDLVDRQDLFQMHADFCSRLALTFSQGDYSRVEEVRHKEKLAETLFKKALDYAPDHRAYLGLGLLKQHKGAFDAAVAVLEDGVSRFPKSEDMHVCLGVTYMNLGRFRDALEHLLPFKDSPGTGAYITACYEALGENAGTA
jgi:anaerobic magnesium-protoporphyrin IX monomethyl ester cyclase